MCPNHRRPRCCVISDYRSEAVENRALLHYYAASSVNFLSTFRDSQSALSSRFKNLIFGSLSPEDGTDRLTRNVGKKLPLLAVSEPRRALFWSVLLPSRSCWLSSVYLICFLDLWGERNRLFTFWAFCRCFSFLIFIPVACFYH